MNLQNVIPPPRVLGSENKFWESLESTDEGLSRERASVGFNNIYIHLSSRSFIEYICLKYPVQHFQIGSWAIASSIPFTINFGIVLNYDLFCPNQSYLGQNYQNVPQVFQWKIFMFLINSFFYMTQPVRLGFLKSLSLM